MSLADQSQQWFPTSVQVTVLQARNLRIKGKNGTNDAYAIMQVAKDKFSTSVAEKCVAPVWKEEATFDLPLFHHGNADRCTLHVHVMHRALVGPDKLLGQAVISLLELEQNKARTKTEWFKLLDKTGKPDKDRGEVLLDIQFMKNNMTASMFDLSSQEKSRSRMGKLKDKIRGKKKDGLSDSASAVVPSFTQVLTDSEGEGEGEGEGGGPTSTPKKKKNKLKSLFVPKSNLQRGVSQSMSTLGTLPERDSALGSSRSSGLNVDSPEGKKKFKFLTHKRTGSSDSKSSLGSFSGLGHPKQAGPPQSNLCINGSHVYAEEPERKPSRVGSTFSLSSSGHGSMEELRKTSAQGKGSSTASGESLRASGSHLQAEQEREEEEERRRRKEEEELERSRWEEEEEERLEKEREEQERRRIQEKAQMEREADEARKRKEEEEEEERRMFEEEEERIKKEEEERVKEEERRRAEEERVRKEQERRRLEEEERIRRQEEEERQRIEKEKEEERLRIEEQRRKEEERKRIEEEDRIKREEERLRIKEERRKEEERKRIEEEDRIKREEERLRIEEQRRKEEERKRIEEEDRIRKEKERQKEEERRLEEKERIRIEEERQIVEERIWREAAERKEFERQKEEEQRREEDRRKAEEEEERRRVEEQIMKEEERRIERMREEEDRKRVEEEMKKEEERRKLEEERIRREKEERERMEKEDREERQRIEEERTRKEEEEKEVIRREEERAEREKKAREEQEQEKERLRAEEEEQIQREEERRKTEREEGIRQEQKEKKKREEETRKKLEEEQEKARLEQERMMMGHDGSLPAEMVSTVATNPFEDVSSTQLLDEGLSSNPFEENSLSTNPFEDPPVSANPFEEAESPHDLSSHSTKVSGAVKPSSTSVQFSSQTSQTSSNPFLTPDEPENVGSISGNMEILTGVAIPHDCTEKKRRAPCPPTKKPGQDNPAKLAAPLQTSAPSSGDESHQLVREGDGHGAPDSSSHQDKRPAPQPPAHLRSSEKTQSKEDARTGSGPPPESEAMPMFQPEKRDAPASSVPTFASQVFRNALQSYGFSLKGSLKARNNRPKAEESVGSKTSDDHNNKQDTSESFTSVQSSHATNPFLERKVSKHNKGPAPKPQASVLPEQSPGKAEQSGSAIKTADPTHSQQEEPSSVDSHKNDGDVSGGFTAEESKRLGMEEKISLQSVKPEDQPCDYHKGEPAETAKPGSAEEPKGHGTAPDSLSRDAKTFSKLDTLSCEESTDCTKRVSEKKTRAPLPPANTPKTPSAHSSDPPSLSVKVTTPVKEVPPDHDANVTSEVKGTEGMFSHPPTISSTAARPLEPQGEAGSVSASSAASPSPSGQRVRLRARVSPSDALLVSTPNGVVEDTGKASGSAPKARRPHAVKPLHTQELPPASSAQAKQEQTSIGMAESTGAGIGTKAPSSETKGPYTQLTQEELISLVLRQQEQLAHRSSKILELEEYIDNLLLRVMEEQPSILMSLQGPKKGL